MEIWENAKIYGAYKKICTVLSEEALTPEEQRYLYEFFLENHKKVYPDLDIEKDG